MRSRGMPSSTSAIISRSAQRTSSSLSLGAGDPGDRDGIVGSGSHARRRGESARSPRATRRRSTDSPVDPTIADTGSRWPSARSRSPCTGATSVSRYKMTVPSDDTDAPLCTRAVAASATSRRSTVCTSRRRTARMVAITARVRAEGEAASASSVASCAPMSSWYTAAQRLLGRAVTCHRREEPVVVVRELRADRRDERDVGERHAVELRRGQTSRRVGRGLRTRR